MKPQRSALSDPTAPERHKGMLTITAKSHRDHGLTAGHINLILERFAGRDGFFIETIELPAELPGLGCSLWGPVVGDATVHDDDVRMVPRAGRSLPSRIFTRGYARPSRLLTVIAGPYHEAGIDCMLYTAFGGPAAPKELSDPTLSEQDRPAAVAFWAAHALAYDPAMLRKA